MSADIIQALNVIESRRLNVLEEPTVVTLATVEAGQRSNVLPAAAAAMAPPPE